MQTLETTLDARGLRVGAVVARFNHLITRRLLEGATARLSELGGAPPEVAWVPGAFEIPLAVQAAARSGRYDAMIAIGVVIRGDTAHFDYVCNAVNDGVGRVALDTGLPVSFCVLTVDTLDQALARAAAPGEKGANKGAEAAEAAVEMARLLAALQRG